MIDRVLTALKRLLILAGVVIVGYVAFMAYISPESTMVTSNADDLIWAAEHAPTTSKAPTTTAHTLTSGPQRTTTTAARRDEATVIYGGRAVTIHRTPVTEQVFRVLDRMNQG